MAELWTLYNRRGPEHLPSSSLGRTGSLRVLPPKYSEVGERVAEFLIGHSGIREHAGAPVPFSNRACTLLVSL